ncbi:MAG: acetyl-CoA carboxylase biotin carboxyl carrier protein [bacterium]|jgi:acetyl-CoA carboxylase biotin carboxyl carrier protein
MTVDDIRELIKIVTETGVAELEVQRGDNRVRIRRVLRPAIQTFTAPAAVAVPEHAAAAPAAVAAPAPVAAAPAAPPPAPAAAPEAAPPAPPDPLSDPSLIIVKSPIVGTFYEAPSPGAPPFTRVGDVVHAGDVLCIIESMKLMNEIEAEHSGTVVARLVQNAQPVEYGEALFAIRPS